MAEDSRIEEKKRYNKPFLAAFDYLAKIKTNGNQGEMAKLIGTSSPHVSDWRAGKKRVSEDMMMALARVSCGKINMHYLRGESQYMLLENVPEDEMFDYAMRRDNPDYDVIKERKKSEPQKIDVNTNDYIRTLKEQVTDIRIQLNDKERIIESQKQHIQSLEKQIADLRNQVEFLQQSNRLEKYPFPMGTAEGLEAPKKDL